MKQCQSEKTLAKHFNPLFGRSCGVGKRRLGFHGLIEATKLHYHELVGALLEGEAVKEAFRLGSVHSARLLNANVDDLRKPLRDQTKSCALLRQSSRAFSLSGILQTCVTGRDVGEPIADPMVCSAFPTCSRHETSPLFSS